MTEELIEDIEDPVEEKAETREFTCSACLAGLYEECYDPIEMEDGTFESCLYYLEVIEHEITPPKRGPGRPPKSERHVEKGRLENAEVNDPISTGRKRAAKAKPILEDMVCEWANLKFAGGGVHPIIGCRGTTLTKSKSGGDRMGHVHHGPDKSTLNNTDPNLHRVCTKCHTRWHALNDPVYPKKRPPAGDPFIPLDQEITSHDKHTLASEAEVTYHEFWWTLPKSARNSTPYRMESTSVQAEPRSEGSSEG